MDRESNEATARHQPPQRFRPLSEIYSELGHTLFKHEQYDGAVQAFRQAIRAEPQAAVLQIHLAQACEGLRQFDDAIRAYLEAVRLEPHRAPVALPKAHDLLDHKRARALREWLESAWRPEMNRAGLKGEPRAA